MAYTYLIGWSKLNIWYYGARWSKKADPSDLWVTYFTSSKAVARFRKVHGEPDVVQVRRVFPSMEAAARWETKVLRRIKAVERDIFLNLNVGCPKPFTAHPRGIAAFRYGKSHTAETRKRLAESKIGSKRSVSSCRKQAETMSVTQLGGGNNNAKSIRLTKIDDSVEVFPSVRDFERKYGLGNMIGYRLLGACKNPNFQPIRKTSTWAPAFVKNIEVI